MFLATSNKARALLYLSYIQQVQPADLEHGVEEVGSLLADLRPGFRLLVDLSQLTSMAVECAPEIGRMMELLDQSGVGLVVRVIPNPQKDIGMNILTQFHYRHQPRVATCADLTEAAQMLSL